MASSQLSELTIARATSLSTSTAYGKIIMCAFMSYLNGKSFPRSVKGVHKFMKTFSWLNDCDMIKMPKFIFRSLKTLLNF